MASTTDTLRSTRDYLLRTTDWTQVSDITLENWEEWVAYRQALRDLPANTEDPTNPEWPDPPQVKIVPGNNTQTQLETELTKIQAELTETKSELATTRAELTTTKTQLDEQRALHETTRADMDSTKADLETIKTDLVTLQAATVNVDLDHLITQITLLQNVVFSLTKRLEALEQA
jgi:hypothetical protein